MSELENLNNTEALYDLMRRIAGTLANEETASDVLHGLVVEAERAIPGARDEAKRAQARLLDPGLSREQTAAAINAVSAAELDVKRLASALSQLNNRYEGRLREEAVEARVAKYERARSIRDLAAQNIKTQYPDLQNGILTLIKQIMEANEEVDRANEDLPEDAAPLERPEGFARGFHDHGAFTKPVSERTFRITQAIFPAISEPELGAWPPKSGHRYPGTRMHQVKVRDLWLKARPRD